MKFIRSVATAIAVLGLAVSSGHLDAKPTSSSSHSSSSYGFKSSTTSTKSATPAPSASPSKAPDATSSGSSKYGFGAQTAPAAAGSAAQARSLSGGTTASDMHISRASASAAAQDFRAKRDAAFAKPSSTPAYAYTPTVRVVHVYHDYDSYTANRTRFYGGYNPPIYIYHSQPTFGVWDAMFLWWMLDHMSEHAHDRWFYDHQYDPGVIAWREQANQLANENADLKAKLAQLDSRTTTMQGPRDQTSMPDDASTDVALAADHVVKDEGEDSYATQIPAQKSHGMGFFSWVLVLGGIGGVGYLGRRFYRRHNI